MERDEHEMLVEYSEMTAFNFNSKEYKKIKEDYAECKNVVSGIVWIASNLLNLMKPARNC